VKYVRMGIVLGILLTVDQMIHEWGIETIGWPAFFAFWFCVVVFTWQVFHIMERTDHKGRFWWVWWSFADWKVWRRMDKNQRAICGAYKVPPALMRGKGTYANAESQRDREWNNILRQMRDHHRKHGKGPESP
jgi:hypothetical protein